jgi:hypothetical protein
MAALGFVYHGIGRATVAAPAEDEAQHSTGLYSSPDGSPRPAVARGKWDN